MMIGIGNPTNQSKMPRINLTPNFHSCRLETPVNAFCSGSIRAIFGYQKYGSSGTK